MTEAVIGDSAEDLTLLRVQLRGVRFLGPREALGGALRRAARAFAVTYGVRSGISLVIRVLQLIRSRPWSLLSLTALLSEDNLRVRIPAVRMGLFVGSFVGVFDAAKWAMERFGPRKPVGSFSVGEAATICAGAAAGCTILAAEPNTRRVVALYALTRAAQCIFNAWKEREYVKPLPHGDALLFILSSAQIMYAYVMRPETLPESYWKFIVKTGPIHKTALDAVRRQNRSEPIQLDSLRQYMQAVTSGSKALPLPPSPTIIPCSVLHPTTQSCTINNLRVLWRTIVVILPQYAALTFVPLVAFRLRKLLQSPARVLLFGAWNLARSTAFISAFVAMYQQVICAFRHVSSVDHKAAYFIAGLYSSLSVFIERPVKRTELALYTLPRALDSFFQMLVDKHYMVTVPYSEVWMFSLASAGLMYFFLEESHHLSWFVKAIFKFAFGEERQDHIESPSNKNKP